MIASENIREIHTLEEATGIAPSAEASYSEERPWKEYEKIAFRIFFIFFFLMTVPLSPDYYKLWFTTDWAHLHIRDIGSLSGRDNGWVHINSESGIYGLGSYINWGIYLLIGIAGGIVWTLVDNKSTHYRKLYYFITAAVSYSMLIKLQGLTFSKVFPTQMPDLALTQLNTPFGDFTAQKLYWLQFSFVHKYEIFAGLAELAIMLLLFFRQTRAFGAALAFAMVGNIAIANHVYDGGVHLLAALYAVGGAFVLWRYLPAIWNLLVKQRDTSLKVYRYPFDKNWEKYVRLAFKSFVFVFFFVIAAYCHWQNYKYDSYKVPSRAGLPGIRGLYDVTEFRVNNKLVPYSPVDSLRWQNVTFEKWSTISYSVFNTFEIHTEAGRGKQFKDIDRTYESAGTGGGRRHFYYEADTVNKVLHLQSKNKFYINETLDLHYDRPSTDRVILQGRNQYNDSIYVVLDRKKTEYPLYQKRDLTAVWKP